MIRAATPSDADDLARIHVQAWRETYTGHLPEDEIAARTFAVRRTQWQNALAAGHSRIAILPGAGFAQTGPQRDDALRTRFPQELYAIYMLDRAKGQGNGLALLRAVAPNAPMSALVLADNARAVAFYQRNGAQIIETRDDHIGQTATQEHLMGWPDTALI